MREWDAEGEILRQWIAACGTEPPGEPRTPGPGEAAQAFREIPLPASEVVVQPPGGETLVDLDTVYSTPSTAFNRTVTILGRQVTLHVSPSSFTWRHGDGTTQTTTHPGQVWSRTAPADALVRHVYTRAAADLRVSVDTTWTATWDLDGVSQGTVPGSVTRSGPPARLTVLEARPVLVP
ncbi:hypothetical protein [Nocardioides solisilvae]|uniref:hypothetical protein n=1 Tax=Nocardioides solisilvae TaxID=1542435 RepID=UPI0013A538C1|nr:hypothetical protein [Nocardioides solisilvae]